MSINVTVTGNPVSIKRGKMINGNPYDDKQEYEKRRLMRLEQVRQQSKEFAQDVRNKVKKEKKKQLGEIEREGKEKLKSWQNRKLLDLQTQYREALDEIGMGHKAVEDFENENELLEQQKLQNNLVAQARGKVAAAKSQIQKNEANYKKALPIQQKKIVRDIENTRAAMVSSLTKHKTVKKCCKKRQKNKSTDINISIPNRGPSETSEQSSESAITSPREGEIESDSECWEDCSCSSEESSSESDQQQAPVKSTSSLGLCISVPSQRPLDSTSRRPLVDQTSYCQSIENRKKLIENFQSQSQNIEYPRDTRISDRIKQRELQASEPDFCDFAKTSKVESVSDVPYKPRSPKKKSDKSLVAKENLDPNNLDDVCECIHYHTICPCKRKSASEPLRNISVQTDQYPSNDKCTCNHHQPECPKSLRRGASQVPLEGGSSTQTSSNMLVQPTTKLSQKDLEVPTKPPIGLKGATSMKSVKTTTNSLPDSQKVNYYDHPNRYQGTIPSTTTVERIGPESLEVMPNIVSETEWHEKMRQRDREAEIRGKKAMEKELIRRDYEDMMKKLPLLQKKEHIAEIGRDKPEYHMSEERLKELERKKQLKLENAFTKEFPDLKPAIVTLPSRKHAIPSSSNQPFDILDPSDPRIKNTGRWDTDFDSPKMFSAQEVQEIIRSFTGQKQEDRYSKLKELLKSLKMQKAQLIKELKALPRDDSVNALLDDLNSVSDSDDSLKHKHKKRDKHEEERRKRHEKDRKRRHTSSEDPSTSSSDSRNKGEYEDYTDKKRSKKKRQKVLVLQNMSTQTTPKPPNGKQSSTSTEDSTKNSKENVILPAKICHKTHAVCDCNSPNYSCSEELCQIFIKLHDNEDPKIEVVNKGDDKKKAKQKSPRESLERKSKIDEKSMGDGVTKIRKSDKEQQRRNLSPKKVETKSVGTDAGVFKKPFPKEPRKVKPQSSNASDPRKDTSRQQSWMEHLSKNSISTSSTSYFSPPDFSKFGDHTANTGSFYNLRKKPKQQNIPSTSFNGEKIDPKVLKYIEKLLNMSKASVDDLQISSSDVQTPSQSIIEMESNNPLAPLHNLVKLINIQGNQVAKQLSYSNEGDISSVPPNSTVNTEELSKTLEKSDQSRTIEKSTSDSCKKSKESLINQYSDVTDTCSKRIANLAAMIEKLREEKMKMLKNASVRPEESPKSGKDYSTTAYLDLPHSESSRNSTVASLDEEELNRRLLEIDMSLAEKLKKFSQEKQLNEKDLDGGREVEPSAITELVEYSDDDNRQFLERLKRLMEKSDEQQPRTSSPKLPTSSNVSENIPLPFPEIIPLPKPPSSLSITEGQQSFVPLLLNIPQLPILEAVPDDYVVEGAPNMHKHPPPSKGLAAIKRLNGNVSVAPHELSTIVEADSQLSTKISPNTSKLSISPSKETAVPQKTTAKIPRSLADEDSPNSSKISIPSSGNSLSEPQKNAADFFKSLVDNETPQTSKDVLMELPKSLIENAPPLVVPEKSLQSHYDGPREKESQETIGLTRKLPTEEKSVSFVEDEQQKNKSKEDPKSSFVSLTQDKTDNSEISTQTSKTSSKSTSSVSLRCTDSTCTNLSSNGSKMSSSNSSSDDLKSLEAMLKSIGMEWAIPTLHKTQEALALTSSSSSPEVTSSRKSKSKTNKSKSSPCCSEVSLKDFLTKQMMSKISSSSMKSEASPASFLQELSDISAIQASSGSEKNKQRTSTPVASKATSKSKDSNVQFFTGASDISSVNGSPRKSQKGGQQAKQEEVFKSLSDSTRSTSNA